MQIGIPRESLAGETRVAATPATVEQLKKLGFEVAIETGAGLSASFDDAAFEAAGASVVPNVWQADLIFKVNAPTEGMWRLMPPRAVAEAVWGAYHKDKIHWYVPEELEAYDLVVTQHPEMIRDQMAQAGLFNGPQE